MKEQGQTAETVLKQFDELYRKYKYMEANLIEKRKRYRERERDHTYTLANYRPRNQRERERENCKFESFISIFSMWGKL